MAQQKIEESTSLNAGKIANTVRAKKEWINILEASFSANEYLKQINASTFLENLCSELVKEHKVDFSSVPEEVILLPALRGVMGRIKEDRTSQKEVSTLAAVIAGMDGIYLRMRDVLTETYGLDFSSIKEDSILKYCATVSLQQASLARPKAYGPEQEYESCYIYYMFKGQELANELHGIRQLLNSLRELLVSKHGVDLAKFESLLSGNGSALTGELYLEMKGKVLAIKSEGSSKPDYTKQAQELAEKYSKLYKESYSSLPSQSIPNIVEAEEIKKEEEVDVELEHELTIRTPDIDENFRETYQMREDTYYIYALNKVGEDNHISQFIDQELKKNKELRCVAQHIDGKAENKQNLIRELFRQALQQALENKNGRLFMEPIGLEFGEIDAQWYADMVADEIFSLKAEQRNQLEISFAIMPGDKHKLFDRKIRNHLMNYRLQNWALEALGYDAENEINSETMKVAINALLEILKRPRLGDLRDKLIQCRSMVPVDPTNLQKKNYLDLKKELFEIFRNLFKEGVLENIDGITCLSKGHEEALLKAAIQTKLTVIKSQQSWDGIRDKMSKGKYIAFHTELQTEEISSALCQLALDNPDKTNELLDVLVCTKGNIQDALLRISEDKRYPRHVIINNARNQFNTSMGGHWTRLKIEKVEEEIEEEIDGSLVKKTVEKTVFTYYDSLVKSSVDTSFLGQDELLQNLFGPQIEKKGVSTGHQPSDGWTCGYHSIAGVAGELGVADIPNCDLSEDSQSRTIALVNWGYKLFADKSYDDYIKGVKPEVSSTNQSSDQQQLPPLQEVMALACQLSHSIGEVNKTIEMLKLLFSVGLSPEQAKVMSPKVGELEMSIREINKLHARFESYPEAVKEHVSSDKIFSATGASLKQLKASHAALKEDENYGELLKPYLIAQVKKLTAKKEEQSLPSISLLLKSSEIFQEWNRKEIEENKGEYTPYQEYYDLCESNGNL